MTLTTEYQLIGSVQQGSAYGATYYQGIYAKYSRTSQQELDNKSTIYIKVCAWNNQSISDYNATGYWIGTLNGLFSDNYRVYATVSGGVAEADRTIMWASSIEVTHNNDGTYSTSIGATNVDAPLSDSVASTIASTTLTLPTIPRAATITQYNEYIFPETDFNLLVGSTTTAFTYDLTISGNNITKKVLEDASLKNYTDVIKIRTDLTYYGFVPANVRQQDVNVTLITKSGNTIIGTNTVTPKVWVTPINTPTITINSIDTGKIITDTTKTTLDLTGDTTGKTIINKWNTISSTWTATSIYNTTIESVSINGSNVTTSPSTLNDISSSIAITATDAREYSTTLVEDDLTFIPYEYPSIVPTIKRNTSTDGHVNLTFTGMFYNVDFGAETNALTLEWYVKEKGTSIYTQGNTPLTYTLNSDNTTYNEATTISLINPIDQVDGLFDYNKVYEFKFVATDKITTYTIENVILTKGIPNFVVFKDTVVANGEPLATALNSNSASTTKTYSANYINGLISGILSSGSNANGNWIKFNDGTMVCWSAILLNNQDTNYHYESATWTYPVAFTKYPVVLCSPNNWTTDACMTKVYPGLTSTLVMQQNLSITTMQFVDRINDYIELIAIGKWQ